MGSMKKITSGMKKWMLGAALAVGALGLCAAPAQAARIGVFVGGPAYVPPCPGAGYSWVAGYWNGGVWVPGYWNFVGVGVRVGPVFHGWYGHPYYGWRGGWHEGYHYGHGGYGFRR